ncbi:MAG: PIG-L deacetylase family protein [Rhizobiaceae bacterium]
MLARHDNGTAAGDRPRGADWLPETMSGAPGRVFVIVAHPDDEAILFGAQLPRLTAPVIIHVTDGAPRDMADARAHSFESCEAYAAARAEEARAALAHAGVSAESISCLGIADQTAAHAMPAIARALAEKLAGPSPCGVLTHAYEGGHPDHDATAFCVHAAAQLLSRRGLPRPSIVEAPAYHLRNGAFTAQRFATVPESDGHEYDLALPPETIALKRRMYAAYRTQRAVLQAFTAERERLRPAPAYDFSTLPNGGELLYERQPWGLTGPFWLRRVEAACRELGVASWL